MDTLLLMARGSRGPIFVAASVTVLWAVSWLAWTSPTSLAAPFGGVEFPAGSASFADVVTAYEPTIVAGEPTEPNRIAARTLGPPDCENNNDPDCYASLGDGGRITLEFVDNRLSGSGDSTNDLYIFEIGPQIEAMTVEISKDGITYSSIGAISGQPSGIDIDAFGFGPGDQFRFVRITDNPASGSQSGPTVGADIDSVGAISSSAPPTTTTTLPTTTSTTTTSVPPTSTTTSTTTTTGVPTTTTSSTTTLVTTTTSTGPRTTTTTVPRPAVLARTGPQAGTLTLIGLSAILVGLAAYAISYRVQGAHFRRS